MIFGNITLLLMVIFSLFFAYYVTCGVNYYSSYGNCFYPVYKNWMPGQKFINEDESVKELDQTFKAECSTIDQMRFWVKGNSTSRGTYEFELLDNQSQQILVKQDIQAIAGSQPGWAEMTFPPLQNQWLHLLEVKTHSLENGAMPAFAVSTRDEYSDGNLTSDGTNEPIDILFQYHCQQDLGQDLKNLFR